MKTFKEYLLEWSYTAPGVDRYLQKRGYKKLGSGVDQTAWMSPDGTVLKIFGASEDGRLDHFSKDHKMFAAWADYCGKNSSNKFLPKYHGWETFEYSEQIYLQIKTERLQKLPKDIGLAIEDVISYQATHILQPKLRVKSIKDFDNNALGIFGGRTFNGKDADDLRGGLAQLMMLLGEKDFDALYQTIVKVAEMGRKNNWGIDLHAGNFMMRADGTPVITDPFVV